jgi:uncharacterized protein YegL
LVEDEVAAMRAEPGLITFGRGGVKVVQEFTTVDKFSPPTLQSGGLTPMGEAIERGIAMVEKRKQEYKDNTIEYYRPWIFLLTDGGPTDDWKPAMQQVRYGEKNRKFLFWAVGTRSANFVRLREISVREPMMLKEANFREMFQWLSDSVKQVSQSKMGEDAPLGAVTWGTAPTK